MQGYFDHFTETSKVDCESHWLGRDNLYSLGPKSKRVKTRSNRLLRVKESMGILVKLVNDGVHERHTVERVTMPKSTRQSKVEVNPAFVASPRQHCVTVTPTPITLHAHAFFTSRHSDAYFGHLRRHRSMGRVPKVSSLHDGHFHRWLSVVGPRCCRQIAWKACLVSDEFSRKPTFRSTFRCHLRSHDVPRPIVLFVSHSSSTFLKGSWSLDHRCGRKLAWNHALTPFSIINLANQPHCDTLFDFIFDRVTSHDPLVSLYHSHLQLFWRGQGYLIIFMARKVVWRWCSPHPSYPEMGIVRRAYLPHFDTKNPHSTYVGFVFWSSTNPDSPHPPVIALSRFAMSKLESHQSFRQEQFEPFPFVRIIHTPQHTPKVPQNKPKCNQGQLPTYKYAYATIRT